MLYPIVQRSVFYRHCKYHTLLHTFVQRAGYTRIDLQSVSCGSCVRYWCTLQYKSWFRVGLCKTLLCPVVQKSVSFGSGTRHSRMLSAFFPVVQESTSRGSYTLKRGLVCVGRHLSVVDRCILSVEEESMCTYMFALLTNPPPPPLDVAWYGHEQ